MKNKNLSKILFLILMIGLMLFVVSACAVDKDAILGVKTQNTKVKELTNWREEIVNKNYKTTGEGVVIDGKVDEPIWNNTYMMEYSGLGINISFGVIFGKDGAYISYKIGDDEAYYNAKRGDWCNSGIDLYFAETSSIKLSTSVLQLRCDPMGVLSSYCGIDASSGMVIPYPWVQKYLPTYGKVHVEGGWQKGLSGGLKATNGASFEIFVAWEALELKEKPAQLKFFPHYNYTNTDDKSATRVAAVEALGVYNDPRDYYLFDDKGYIKSDKRLEKEKNIKIQLGDGATLLAKSNAWDFSNIANGELSTVDAHGAQIVYFKDICANEYMLSVDVKHNSDAYGDPGARTGLLVGEKNNSKQALSKYRSSFLLGCNNADKGMVKTFEEPGWVMSANKFLGSEFGKTDVTTDFVNLKIVKSGKIIHYFVNNKQLLGDDGTRFVEFMEGETVPGLYTLGSNSTFKNIKVDTDEAIIKEYLGKHGICVAKAISSEGGSLSGEVTHLGNVATFNGSAAFKKGDSVKFMVKPTISRNSVYEIKSLKINSINKLNELVNGEITLNDVQSNILIEVEFSRVLKTFSITGIVTPSSTADFSKTLIKIKKLKDFPNSEFSTAIYEFLGVRATDNTSGTFNFILPVGKYAIWVGYNNADDISSKQYVSVLPNGSIDAMNALGEVTNTNIKSINLSLNI